MPTSRSRFHSKGDRSAPPRPWLMPIFVTLAACSGTLIIGEGEQLSDAASGAAGASVLEASVDGPAEEGAAGAAGLDSAAGGAGGTGVGGDANPVEGGESAAGSGGIFNPDPIACGSDLCAKPLECCYLTAECFDPSTQADACLAPAEAPGEGGEPCGADSHCAPGEYCWNSNTYSCTGAGRCKTRDALTCQGTAAVNETCACDGVTRPEVDSCLMGIRALSGWIAKCGESRSFGARDFFFCGHDSAWCPDGTQCCGITGYCYDPAVPELCEVPPSWAVLPCITTSDCPMNISFCQGPTCDAPGGCKRIVPEEKYWEPVCGCNGKSYENDTWAAAAGVPTKHEGLCDDGGL